ncbi:putative toxin biosynthesis cytochrome P450 monooxygenase [Tothia fuscella]|uniref:Toxin biosynthesis cytochrome P450 monooxygenase n=1 Tax=Tothia fuscella TaxID=1048955 RepID=A0A9P4NFP8_9PEZI|nr:putative toxin biosynthesis cytochrome P450 monooxygenase [Tothia fuscella]
MALNIPILKAYLVLVAPSLGILYLITFAVYRIWFHPLSSFPGPRLWAVCRLPWHYRLVTGDLPRTLQNLHAQYGEVVRTAPDELSFISASAQRDIHVHSRSKYFQKDKSIYPKRHPTIDGILTASDEDHARHRKVFNPAFSERALRGQEPIFKIYTDGLIALLDKGKATLENPDATNDFVKAFNWTTFDIVGHLTFGEPFGCLRDAAYHPWVSMIFDNIKSGSFIQAIKYYPVLSRLYALLIPKSLLKKRADHEAFTHTKVSQRMEKDSEMPDFFSYIENKGTLSRLEIDLDCGTILIAGSETTATTMSGVVYYLCRTPRAMQRLQDEVRSSFEREDDITSLEVGKLSYLTACIEEGLRMYPSIPTGLARRLEGAEGLTVSGYFVPLGTVVSVAQYSAYRSPTNFVNPNDYCPERWVGAPEFEHDCREVVQSFGLGARNCIGQAMAYLEMRLILARLIFRFDLELTNGADFSPEKQKIHFLWSKPPLYIRVSDRVN